MTWYEPCMVVGVKAVIGQRRTAFLSSLSISSIYPESSKLAQTVYEAEETRHRLCPTRV